MKKDVMVVLNVIAIKILQQCTAGDENLTFEIKDIFFIQFACA